jgi:hypothetical protein
MSSLRFIVLLVFLTLPVVAEVNPLNTSPLPHVVAAGSSVAASTSLPAVSLPEQKRPLALALGIGLVLVTFHRALARRQRA